MGQPMTTGYSAARARKGEGTVVFELFFVFLVYIAAAAGFILHWAFFVFLFVIFFSARERERESNKKWKKKKHIFTKKNNKQGTKDNER